MAEESTMEEKEIKENQVFVKQEICPASSLKYSWDVLEEDGRINGKINILLHLF